MPQRSSFLEDRVSFVRPRLNQVLFALMLLTMVSAFVSAPASAASDFDRGNEAYVDGMYAEAAQFWQRGSERGDGLSQFNLAVLYEHGNGVSQDFSKAIYWYRKAANQNVMSAQSNLANIFLEGTTNIPRSVNKAVYWYLKAADLGHADSQFAVAKLLIDGVEGHLDVDLEAAQSWLTVAARNGHVQAQATLDWLRRELETKRFAHIRRDDWVKTQPDIAWTVELYRANESVEALTYVEAIGLGGAAVVSDASLGFVVLAGVFESEQQGQAAIRDLPAQLRARLPRVRQFGDVKSALAASTLLENFDDENERRLEITEYAEDGTVSKRILNPAGPGAAGVDDANGRDSQVTPSKEATTDVTLASDEVAALSEMAVSKRQVEITEKDNTSADAIAWTIVLQVAPRAEDIDVTLIDHTLSEIWIHESNQDGLVRALMGRFADRESAESAKNRLPAKILGSAPAVVNLYSL